MPYNKFTKIVQGKKKWCTKNKNTGQTVCYQSPKKRQTGIRMHEAFAHGFTMRKRPSRHIRRYRSGKRALVNPKISKAVIDKRERRIFDGLSTDTDLGYYEFGGTMDFEKYNGKTKLEKFTTQIGTEPGEIYLDVDKDNEVYWHTHPKTDVLALSDDDLKEIVRNKKQQGEILFQNGGALIVMKPKKIKKNVVKDYGKIIEKVRTTDMPDKKIIKQTSNYLKRKGFKVKINKPGSKIIVPIKVY